MRTCKKCGCGIVYGWNGCMFLDVCFACNGGHPRYPEPRKAEPQHTAEELDALEDRCLGDDYAVK